MINRNISECIIVNNNNEILLQKKTLDYKTEPGGIWCLFGGEIEVGESPEEAIIRELKEELNFFPKKLKLFKVYDYKIGEFSGKENVFIAFFDGEISDIKLSEGAGFAFFDISELNSLNIARIEKRIFRDYIESLT